MLMLLAHPQFASVALWVSCFEIYGGKLYDLLNARGRLETREDGKKRVCIVGLKEYNVEEVVSFSMFMLQYCIVDAVAMSGQCLVLDAIPLCIATAGNLIT